MSLNLDLSYVFPRRLWFCKHQISKYSTQRFLTGQGTKQKFCPLSPHLFNEKCTIFWEGANYSFKFQTAGTELKQQEIKLKSVAGGQITRNLEKVSLRKTKCQGNISGDLGENSPGIYCAPGITLKLEFNYRNCTDCCPPATTYLCPTLPQLFIAACLAL